MTQTKQTTKQFLSVQNESLCPCPPPKTKNHKPGAGTPGGHTKMFSFDSNVSKSPRQCSYFLNIQPKPVKSNSVSKKSNAPFPKKYSLTNSSEKKRASSSAKKEKETNQ